MRISITQRSAIQALTPVFQTIRKSPVDLMTLKMWCEVQLVDVLNLISPESFQQNEKTVAAFVEDIMETRQDWKPEDIIMFCKYLRQEIKPVNTRTLNILHMTEALAGYEDRRAEMREILHLETKKGYLEKSSEPLPANASENLQVIYQTLAQGKPELEPLPERKPDPVQQKVNQWIKEFDKLKGFDDPRFAKVNGKMITVDDYILLKHEQEQEQIIEGWKAEFKKGQVNGYICYEVNKRIVTVDLEDFIQIKTNELKAQRNEI